jgi:hypothetical protein
MYLWLILCMISFNVFAYDEADDKSVQGIIDACHNEAHAYSDFECFEAIISNTYTVPEPVLCTYLPLLKGCP